MKKNGLLGIFIFLGSIFFNTLTVFAQGEVITPGQTEYSRRTVEISWGLVILIPLIIALIACAIASGSMRSVHKAVSAARYEKEGSFVLTNRSDHHVNTTQQRIHHERSAPQGGGQPMSPK